MELAISIFILVFGLFVFIGMMRVSKKHKAFIKSQKPCRLLSKEELEAIHYFDIDKPILNILRPRLPTTKKDKSVYCFSNHPLMLQEHHNNQGFVVYFFTILVDSESIQITVPKYFLEYIQIDFTKAYNLACVNRHGKFVLVEIEGMVSYPKLHNAFKLKNALVDGSISKRVATKEEEKLFLFSKWGGISVSIFLITFPLLFLMFFEEPSFFLFMTPFWLPMVIFIFLSYKKRKRYMEDALILYRVNGTLQYDDLLNAYFIDDVRLKLPFQWHQYIKNNFLLSSKIQVEAFLHTFDTLNGERSKSFQPIVIESNGLKIDYRKLPIVRSIWIPLLAFIFMTVMVFGMHFDKFIPYTYHAFNTASAQTDFYSSDGFRQSKVTEKQYVETLGLSLPILSKNSSLWFPSDTIETDENYLFFPLDVTQSILDYPKVPPEFSTVIEKYKKIEFNIHALKTCRVYKSKSVIDFCISSSLRSLQMPYEIFKPFKTYDAFLKETTPETFKAFSEELFVYYHNELYAFYNKLKPLTKEGITYRRYPENSNYRPKSFYQNMEYLNYMFGYLETFPKTETLAGIVSHTDRKVWHVEEDNYNHLSYALFLTIFWFVSVVLMLYFFGVLMKRIIKMNGMFVNISPQHS